MAARVGYVTRRETAVPLEARPPGSRAAATFACGLERDMKTSIHRNRDRNQIVGVNSRRARSRDVVTRAVCTCHLAEHLERRVLLSSYTLGSIPFEPAKTGSNPHSLLVADASGNLYGTTLIQ
jgi:hypothetical protein